MRCFLPGEKPYESLLEDENDTDSSKSRVSAGIGERG